MGGFDYLRLIAATLVVAHHARVLDGRPPIMIGPSLDLGALGVGLFFAISGYLVTGSLKQTPRVGTFVAKRALRIFPGLLAALLVTAFIIGPMSTTLSTSAYLADPDVYGYMLKNLTLYAVAYDLPGVFLTVPVAGVVNGSLWTLRLEFTAYLALAALGAARQATPRTLTVLALVAAAGSTVVHVAGLDARDDLFRIAYLAGVNGFLFLSGAALKASGRQPPLWLAGAAVILLATPVWFLGLPLIVLRLGAVDTPRLPVDLSYGLYIYSFPLQQMLAERSQLSLAKSLALTLPFALASWLLVEKPALRLKARLPRAPAKPILSPAAAAVD
ncbi:acyltransferase [Caulobacter segnis]|nr:acyltransferase [Caulobacter segnis]AVQ00966.1 acyltransferase [Caulobacter segnis]